MSFPVHRLTVTGLAALGVALAVPIAAHAHAQAAGSPGETPAKFEPVRQAVLQTLEQAKIPSIAVAVVQDGEIVWEEAFGWADKARRIPATVHTPYSLASMTKPITATAVMRLRDAGKLDIDAPIERYLGGMRLSGGGGKTDGVTARRIMAHSAGLPQFGGFHLDGSKPAGSAETIARFGMVVFPPNTRFEYSNIGMKILDAAVEQVSGRTFGDYLRREVFLPLGMKDSAVGVRPGAQEAVRYDAKGAAMRFYLTDHPGSGDVWASAHDMARFLSFHMNGPTAGQAAVLKPATRLEMQKPASAAPMPTPPGAPRRDIGANWIVSTSNGHPQIWHSGGQPGVSTVMAFFPEQKMAFVLLANSSAPLGRVGQAIRQAMAPELLEAETPPARTAPAPIPFRGRWSGSATSYAGPQALALTFAETGEASVAFDGQAPTPLAKAGFEDGALTGVFAGKSNMAEARGTPHEMMLKVVEVDGVLQGELVAQGMSEATAFMLPSFVRLVRED